MSDLKINYHKDHIASCLCCEHLELHEKGPPYSDVSGGDAAYFECRREVFRPKYAPDQEDFHSLQIIGQTCPKFQARKE